MWVWRGPGGLPGEEMEELVQTPERIINLLAYSFNIKQGLYSNLINYLIRYFFFYRNPVVNMEQLIEFT